MSNPCGVSFGICTVRLTRLDADGNVIAGLNSYVSDKAISVGVNPNLETGNTFSARNGCGCSLARFKVRDTFNWFEFVFTQAALESEMLAFLLGQDTITDPGASGTPTVGLNFSSVVACDDDEPAVGFEFWTQHIVGSAQDSTFPWFHWVFPRTIWQLGDNTFEEALAQPVVNGFSRTNDLWGHGPYGDGPPDNQQVTEWAVWATDVDPPTAECEAQSVTATS
jgi:hypothetical protein